MSFDRIRGQEEALAALRQALERDRLGHAYLFSGPDGVGKGLTARALAKAMICPSFPAAKEACGGCPSCLKVDSSNHPDLILVEPEGDVIRIDQVRVLKGRLRFHPLEGGRRACLIEAAERMNPAAANALLKTLEEPPAGTHFFLITARPHLLPPTILSRCQGVKFRSLTADQIREILEKEHGLEPPKAQFFAALAGGSAGRALALSRRVDFQKRLAGLRAFGEISRAPWAKVLESCERLAKGEEELEELLDLWKFWIRDLLVYKAGGQDLINQDLKPEVAEAAPGYSFERLHFLFDRVSGVQRNILSKVSRQLLLEDLMLDLRASR
ncbi:MAG: DNA polymerase III subunit delta' [Deltaproteobacteria bacterium]|nr:DNA polymerase III subunit delta' [Deltaproteobacteria bacterium]